MMMRRETGIMIALEEEGMVGGGLVLTEDHQVQCITGAQVLIMVGLAALSMTGTMAQYMTSAGVLIMVETEVLIMVGTGAQNMADSGGIHACSVFCVGYIILWNFAFIKFCVCNLLACLAFPFFLIFPFFFFFSRLP
jgi:hypothetical protein